VAVAVAVHHVTAPQYSRDMTREYLSGDSAVLDWMLDTDPALRWQVERDLAGAPRELWLGTCSRVATEGFGAKLLALQDADGQWAGGAYFPKDFDFEGPEAADGAGQPYTATTWSLNALRDWGLEAAALAGTAEKLSANSHWEYNPNLSYWMGEVDVCINSFTLANGAWLGADISGLAQWFIEHQMDEGGWNCEWENGSTRSSFHSTLNALKGILYFEKASGGSDELRGARLRAQEYLLERQLMNRISTGQLVAPWVDRFAYPFRWFYSVLNAVDYFRAAALHDGTAPDSRLAKAVETIRADREADGRWIQGRRHPGQVSFEVDVDAGQPSPWLTFYATRALAWWDGAGSASE
jgi:hypothetical protein